MGNYATVDAITDNIKAILTAQGFQLEDLGIGTDKIMTTIPYVMVNYVGEKFDHAHGQRPLYNQANFELVFYINSDNPTTAKEKAQEFTHKIQENVTIDTLNVGALLSSKLVSQVYSNDSFVDYDQPLTRVTYSLYVRYREV
ncbi:MAG: hypothetical protein KAR06_00710 [Deltaproteobacteria bacterium]|nr:hypothetical protein [Deltaproteobacteria bacterium]